MNNEDSHKRIVSPLLEHKMATHNSTEDKKVDETTAETNNVAHLCEPDHEDDGDETEEEVEEEITEYYTVKMNLASDGRVLETTYIPCDDPSDTQQSRSSDNSYTHSQYGLGSGNVRSGLLDNGKCTSYGLGTPSVVYQSGNGNSHNNRHNNRNWGQSSLSTSGRFSNTTAPSRCDVPRTLHSRNYPGTNYLESESNVNIVQSCNGPENQGKKKSGETNANPKTGKFHIPQKTDVFIKHNPASGGSDIQTITRTDSKTDNVVVLIRPRASTPEFDEDEQHPSLDKTKQNECISPKPHSFDSEVGTTKDNSFNTYVNSISGATERESPENVLIERSSSKSRSTDDGFSSPSSSPVKDNAHENVFDYNADEREEHSGAKPKLLQRDRAKSFPETRDNVNAQSRGVRYDSDPPINETRTGDKEEEVYRQLLQSMKSVTSGTKFKAKSEGQHTDVPDSPVKDINCDRSPDEESGSNLSDQSLSERLKKKQAGGVTVITFISPRYDKTSAVNFTPLKCSKTKTIPVKARELFHQHADNTKRSLPSELSLTVKDKDNQKSAIHTSPKLLSPRLHLDRLLGDGSQGDIVTDESKVK